MNFIHLPRTPQESSTSDRRTQYGWHHFIHAVYIIFYHQMGSTLLVIISRQNHPAPCFSCHEASLQRAVVFEFHEASKLSPASTSSVGVWQLIFHGNEIWRPKCRDVSPATRLDSIASLPGLMCILPTPGHCNSSHKHRQSYKYNVIEISLQS